MSTSPHTFTLALGIALLTSSAGAAPTATEIFAGLGFDADQQARALAGELVTTERKDSSEREIHAVMAFVVEASPAELVEEFYREADYGADPGVTAYGTIDAGASVEALRDVRLQPGGSKVAQSYLAPDSDQLNLSKEEAAAFRKLSGTDTTRLVEEQLRSLLLGRYERYRAAGLDGIPPYYRDGRTYQPSEDLRRALDSQTLMSRYAPSFERVLREYPGYRADGLREQFLWVNFELDGLPTFVLSHRISMPLGDGVHVGSERQYYVSRSHNIVQTFSGVFPVEEGSLVFYENRTSTDRVTGFGSSARHTLGRKVMASQIGAIFDRYRATKKGSNP